MCRTTACQRTHMGSATSHLSVLMYVIAIQNCYALCSSHLFQPPRLEQQQCRVIMGWHFIDGRFYLYRRSTGLKKKSAVLKCDRSEWPSWVISCSLVRLFVSSLVESPYHAITDVPGFPIEEVEVVPSMAEIEAESLKFAGKVRCKINSLSSLRGDTNYGVY